MHIPLVTPRLGRVFAAAAVLAAATALLPPVVTEAAKYLWVQAFQFLLLAFAVPAFAALALPSRRRPIRAGHLWMVVAVLLEVAAQVAWRVPAAVDALAHRPWLAVLEGASLAPVGVLLWSFLVAGRSPDGERDIYPWRMAMAAIVMWSTWVMAYVIGFSRSAWYPAYGPRPGLSVSADQQITTGVLWVGAGLAFLPTIFWCLWQLLAPERREGSGDAR